MHLVGTGAMLQHLMRLKKLNPRTLAEQAKTNKDTIYRLIGEQQMKCNGDVGRHIELALDVPAGSLFRTPKRSSESHTNVRRGSADVAA